MKLIQCNVCHDIFNLSYELKSCSCGESGGKYTNILYAEISGNCEIIGFDNNKFYRAIYANNKAKEMGYDLETGIRFEAFIIPENAKTIKRL
ncbi:MAG: hypothetical protein OEY34_07590 [Cyclobacteriaceae bacterium]|nr:hypothetical protein [Cyclobacteriaceae bacterium]